MKDKGFKDDTFLNSSYDGDINDISEENGAKEKRSKKKKDMISKEQEERSLRDEFLPKDEAKKAEEEKSRRERSVLHRQTKKQNERQNKEILRVTYFFVALFIAVIGYLVYFQIKDGASIASSELNARVEKFNETVIKGSILADNGEVLAETVTDNTGNERREYPYGRVFAHVVGTSEINKSGLEASEEYNLLQSDEDPLDKAVNEFNGEKNKGNNVKTTLNVALQQAAYDALGDSKGVVMAMDPETGKILCMVSKPDYDPNTLVNDYASLVEDPEGKALLNQAVNGLFTPGSIFKIFTTVSYVREFGLDNDFSYNCNGQVTLANSILTCYGSTAHGTVDMTKAFSKSCNTAYATMGNLMDKKRFKDACESMLFNKALPTKLTHLKSSFSLSESADDWTTGVTAMGQGETLMTPLHGLVIASAIANDGILMEPYLVDSITSADGKKVSDNMPVSYGRLLSSEEAAYMQGLMEEVVKSGTGYGLINIGFPVAGKTGTAEVEGKGNNDWFIGYSNVEGRKLAICVLVEDASESSSLVAIPVARNVLSAYYK